MLVRQCLWSAAPVPLLWVLAFQISQQLTGVAASVIVSSDRQTINLSVRPFRLMIRPRSVSRVAQHRVPLTSRPLNLSNAAGRRELALAHTNLRSGSLLTVKTSGVFARTLIFSGGGFSASLFRFLRRGRNGYWVVRYLPQFLQEQQRWDKEQERDKDALHSVLLKGRDISLVLPATRRIGRLQWSYHGFIPVTRQPGR